MINEELADRQGLSKQTRLEIEKLHKGRSDIFTSSQKLINTDYKKEIQPELQRELFSDWLDIEKSLQLLWGFDEEDRFIKFWEFPACGCPTMDNNDAYPTGYYVIDGGCMIHGAEVKGE